MTEPSPTMIHYAVQVCDTASREVSQRFAHEDRTVISKKSIASLLHAIDLATQRESSSQHHVILIADQCSQDLLHWIQQRIDHNTNPGLCIELMDLAPETGIVASIRRCWEWLRDHGKDVVFQVQDDYLFEPQCVIESLDMLFGLLNSRGLHAVVQPFNDVWFWTLYENRQTPRLLVFGTSTYWIQIYDTSCSFVTTHQQFVSHWDLYEDFLDRLANQDSDLENRTLNQMFTQRGVWGFTPMMTLSHHLQIQPDPYRPWRPTWDATDIDISPDKPPLDP